MIKIPVKCQNGHETYWNAEIKDIELILKTIDEPCLCPKFNLGEGYSQNGEVIISND